MADIAIAYRIYPGVSHSPAVFSDDKYKLSEMCLHSFKSALGGLRVKLWALLDGCPPEYEAIFRKMFQGGDLEIVSLNKVGNYATYSLQIELLARQTDAPYVYFAEDDYFYFPNALEDMLAFMREHRDVDFVSAYDHPDSYFTSSRVERHLVRPFGDRYWRTASSTCLTFLTSRENLISTKAMLSTFCHGNMDCSVWLALTQKLELMDPRVHWHDIFRLKAWVRTLRWGYRALLFGRRYRLWTPMPALGTHMESSCLSPLIDWPTVFRNFQDKNRSL